MPSYLETRFEEDMKTLLKKLDRMEGLLERIACEKIDDQEVLNLVTETANESRNLSDFGYSPSNVEEPFLVVEVSDEEVSNDEPLRTSSYCEEYKPARRKSRKRKHSTKDVDSNDITSLPFVQVVEEAVTDLSSYLQGLQFPLQKLSDLLELDAIVQTEPNRLYIFSKFLSQLLTGTTYDLSTVTESLMGPQIFTECTATGFSLLDTYLFSQYFPAEFCSTLVKVQYYKKLIQFGKLFHFI